MLRKATAFGLVVVILLVISPRPAQAKFVDQSGDLPGTVSTKTLVLIAAAGGAAIAFLLWNRSRDRDPQPASANQAQNRRFENHNEWFEQWIEQTRVDPRFQQLWQLGDAQADGTAKLTLKGHGGPLFLGN